MGADYELVRVDRPVGKCPTKGPVFVRAFGRRQAIEQRLASIRAGAGRPLDLIGDPVRAVHMDHAAPWSLLPIADALADLGPFAIHDVWARVWHDPSTFRPKPPRRRSAVFERLASGENIRWSARSQDAFTSSVGLHAHGANVIVTDHGYATAVDAATGKTRWTMSCGRGYVSSALAGSTLIVGSEEPHLRALNARDGAARWKIGIGGDVRLPPVGVDAGRVAVATDKSVHVVNTRRGRLEWTVDVPRVQVLAATPELAVAGTSAGELLVLETSEGRVIERRAIELSQPSHTALLGFVSCEGAVLLARRDAELQLIRLRGLAVLKSIPRALGHTGTFRLGDALIDGIQDEDGVVLSVFDARSLKPRFEIFAPRLSWAAPVIVEARSMAAIVRGNAPGTCRLDVMDLRTGKVLASRPLDIERGDAVVRSARGFVVAAQDRLIGLR
jgi:hypothetical protein